MSKIPIGICMLASLKAAADRRAQADRVSFSEYVLGLIARDVRKRPITPEHKPDSEAYIRTPRQ